MMAGAGPLARSALVLAVTVVAHVGLLAHITPAGVIVDPLVLLAVAGGMMGGRSTGASFGGACGLASDLILHTPFGMSLLVLTLVGYLSGAVTEQVPSAGRLARSAMASLLAAGGIGLFAGVGWLMDLVYVTEAPLVRIAIVTGIASLLTNSLLERVARWALIIRPRMTVSPESTARGG
jgi:cell shape-determining protein MreD